MHVVSSVPRYDPSLKKAWEAEHLQPLEQYMAKADKALPPIFCLENWPVLPHSGGTQPLTPLTETPSTHDNESDSLKSDVQSVINDDTHVQGPDPSELLHSFVSKVYNAAPSSQLASYLNAEKHAHQLEMMTSMVGSEEISCTPLQAAIDNARAEVALTREMLKKGCYLTCWLLEESLCLLAASTDGLLNLIDVTASMSAGQILNVHKQPSPDLYPLRNFTFRVIALPFQNARSEQSELLTEGHEVLEIDGGCTTFLVEGWVSARLAEASTTAYLWFPLERCRVETNQLTSVV